MNEIKSPNDKNKSGVLSDTEREVFNEIMYPDAKEQMMPIISDIKKMDNIDKLVLPLMRI
jgi:hypothetical protein